ncbi:unnamed protein product [Allacma fusca]|uniref:Uncharacterized protein n=1 Tax=Allacma fusca TaxID=39272 RepID=A0A8J2L2J7_9HEXA|nr:unnamed protein product [Allacma fusca]
MDADDANGFVNSRIKAEDIHDEGSSSESSRSERLDRLFQTLVFTSKHQKIHKPSDMQDLSLDDMELDIDGSVDCESCLSSALETSPDSSFMNKAFKYGTSEDEGRSMRETNGQPSTDTEVSNNNSILNTALLTNSPRDEDTECSYLNSTFEVDTSMQGRSRLSIIFEEDSIDLLLYDNDEFNV